MTENTIYFAVGNKNEPKQTDALYNIKKIDAPPIAGEHVWEEANWYEATTYFNQLKALDELAHQYKDNVLFFGFTGADCDFRLTRIKPRGKP